MKKILRKQFEWQKSNFNYASLLAVLIAWAFGGGPAGVNPKIVLGVFSGGSIILGALIISSKWLEMDYEKELFDKRKNKKNPLIDSILFLLHAWIGIFLMILGIYFLWVIPTTF